MYAHSLLQFLIETRKQEEVEASKPQIPWNFLGLFTIGVGRLTPLPQNEGSA